MAHATLRPGVVLGLLLALAPATGLLVDPADVPRVKHLKTRSRGYNKDSPLYRKQELMRDLGSPGVTMAGAQVRPVKNVSTTFKCITYIASLYVLVHSAYIVASLLKVLQVVGDFELKHFAGYVETLFMAPMLCILFLAGYLRADYLALGMPDRYDLPPWWVDVAMISITVCLFLQFLLALIYSMVTKQDWLNATQRSQAGACGTILLILRYAIGFGIYAGFTVVCFGICYMEAPKDLWGKAAPEVSPPVWCTVFLAVLFFTVYLVLGIMGTLKDLRAKMGREEFRRFENTAAIQTTAFNAPMLCVLFIAARLRAIQLDPEGGRLQSWAPPFYYVCAFAVFVQTVVAVVGIAMGVQLSGPDAPPTSKLRAHRGLLILRDLALWVMYWCVLMVIFSVYLLGQNRGEKLPDMPPSIKCTMFLTCVYFAVFLGQMIMRSINSMRQPILFVKGDACEALDDGGNWWPMTVSVANADGSYSLTLAGPVVSLISTGDHDIHWTKAFPENMRAATGRKAPAKDAIDEQEPPVAARESFASLLQKFLCIEAKDAVDIAPVVAVLFLAAFLRAMQVTAGRGAPPKWTQTFMYVATGSLVLMIVAQIDYLFDNASRSTKRVCLMIRCVLMLLLCTCLAGIIFALFVMNDRDATGVGSLVGK